MLSHKSLDRWRGTCWFLVTHVAAQTLVLLVSKSRLLPQPFGWMADTLWVLCAPPLVPRARATCGPYVWRSSQNKSEHDPKTTLVCVCVCVCARVLSLTVYQWQPRALPGQVRTRVQRRERRCGHIIGQQPHHQRQPACARVLPRRLIHSDSALHRSPDHYAFDWGCAQFTVY